MTTEPASRWRVVGRWGRGLPLLAALLTVLGACESAAGPERGSLPTRAEIYRHGTSERIASMHGDFWYGRLDLREGEALDVDVRFLDADNAEIPIVGGRAVRVELAPGVPQGLIGTTSQAQHLRLMGDAAGEARLLIHFEQDGRTRWTAPALPAVVHERGRPVTAEVYRRGTAQRLAYVHGDHWHGQLTLSRGTRLEVEVRFLDATNRVIALGEDYTVRGELSAGARADVVTLTSRSDFLEIDADRTGSTTAVIHFWHEDRARWSTPALAITVN